MSQQHAQRRRMHQGRPAPAQDEGKKDATGATVLPAAVKGRAERVDVAPVKLGLTPVKVLDAVPRGRLSVGYFSDGPGRAVFGGRNVTINSGHPIEALKGYVDSDAPNAEVWAVTDVPGTTLRVIPCNEVAG